MIPLGKATAGIGISSSMRNRYVWLRICAEETFANPFATPTGPTAHVAPSLPLIQYLILKFIGDGPGGWLALRCLPAFALSLQLALLPWLAHSLDSRPQLACWRRYSDC